MFVTAEPIFPERLQYRLEAAVARTADRNGTMLWRPNHTKGWRLYPRRENEAPILVINTGAVDQLYDLPVELII